MRLTIICFLLLSCSKETPYLIYSDNTCIFQDILKRVEVAKTKNGEICREILGYLQESKSAMECHKYYCETE